jgi:hypothetical protein
MNIAEALEKIEGDAFAAVVNLASDFRTFLRILASQPESEALASALGSEAVAQQVFARVLELTQGPVDETYEHPADAALAAYLWLLNGVDGQRSRAGAEAVLQARQCWWARQVAWSILERAREQEDGARPAEAARGQGIG